MIIGIEGSLGVGKTLALTFLGLVYSFDNYDIFSNYNLRFKHTKVNSIGDLINKTFNRKTCLLGDELWQMIDARSSQSIANKFITKMLIASRKRNFNLLYTQQYHHLTDIRIRTITDYWIYPNIYDEILSLLIVSGGGKSYTLELNKYPLFKLYDTNEIVDLDIIDHESKYNIRKDYMNKARNYIADNYDAIQTYTNKKEKEAFLYLHGFDNVKLNTLLMKEIVTSD